MTKSNINFKQIFHLLGYIWIVEAFFMSWIFLFSYELEERDEFWILITVIITFLAGLGTVLITYKNRSTAFYRKDSFLLVTLSWITVSFLGSLPYYITGEIPSFIDAFFESVSGFTTTGSSILTDIEALPKSLLLWRSLTHWIGGIGIVVMFIGLFPWTKASRIYLFNAEASVVVEEKPFPTIKLISKRLLLIYLILTIAEIILLRLTGMSLFDSVCHSFATVATGGFSTKNSSIAGYPASAQYIIAIFMILSATNFNIYLFALKGKFKSILKNEEYKAYLAILFVAVATSTIALYKLNHKSLSDAFRLAFFNVSSIMTATGFATDDYLQWAPAAYIMIVLVMFIGASSGSTGGGVKVIRYVIAFKKIRITLRELIHNNLIALVRYNRQVVDDTTVNRVFVFILTYFGFVILGAVIMILTGVDPVTSIGSTLTAMGGMGPGLGLTGPAGNFSMLPGFDKILLSVLMIVGRLEIFSILVIFSPNFWKP